MTGLPANRAELVNVRLGHDLAGFHRPFCSSSEIDFDCYASDFKSGVLGAIFARPELHPVQRNCLLCHRWVSLDFLDQLPDLGASVLLNPRGTNCKQVLSECHLDSSWWIEVPAPAHEPIL